MKDKFLIIPKLFLSKNHWIAAKNLEKFFMKLKENVTELQIGLAYEKMISFDYFIIKYKGK